MEKVKVFTTPTCVFCHALMEWLDEKGVGYEEVDISVPAERAKAEALVGHEISSTPISYIYGQEIVGFDRPAIKKALKVGKNA